MLLFVAKGSACSDAHKIRIFLRRARRYFIRMKTFFSRTI